MKPTRPLLPVLIQLVLTTLLLYLLWWRWQVGMHRFFDVDEYSYLHWTANFARGQRPYVDFFMFFTPGFLFVFAPLVAFFSYTSAVFIAGRVAAFVIFLGILYGVGALFMRMRSRRWVLLPLAVLSFLPMPFDKFMEVRPDNLATLFVLWGVVFQVEWLYSSKRSHAILTGLFYALSLLTFVKTVPIVAVGCAVVLLTALWAEGKSLRAVIFSVIRGKKEPLTGFLLAFCIPFVLFLLWTVTLGDFNTIWYSLTKLPFEANMIGKLGVMEPHLFFFPNGSFYGGSNTVTLPLILNNAIWFIAIVMGAYRLFSPFITAGGDKRRVLAELLVGGSFFLSAMGYVRFFPLKHSQYLIPIAVFVAFYFGDLAIVLLRKAEKSAGVFVSLVLVIVFGWYLSRGAVITNTIKLSWNNDLQQKQMDILIDSVPKTAGVVDLEGRMLFWKDDYHICCVPFGSFVPFLSRKPEPLARVLERRKTPYIFQGDSNRISLLSAEDRQYIQDHYAPAVGWGNEFFARIAE